MSTNTPAKAGDNSLMSMLQSDRMADQFAAVLPKACPPDRFVRFALTCVRKVPKLQECSQESVLKCFMECAELGIEPDGRRAHVIPYGKEATLVLDYKGLIELILRSGKVKGIRAEAVCENDVFHWRNGEIEHQVNWMTERGAAKAYYAVATLENGEQSAVMTRAEVRAIRDKSKAGKHGPWVDHFDEMAKKTVIRRLAKLLPLSAETMVAMDKDGDRMATVMEPQTTRPVFTRTVAPSGGAEADIDEKGEIEEPPMSEGGDA